MLRCHFVQIATPAITVIAGLSRHRHCGHDVPRHCGLDPQSGRAMVVIAGMTFPVIAGSTRNPASRSPSLPRYCCHCGLDPQSGRAIVVIAALHVPRHCGHDPQSGRTRPPLPPTTPGIQQTQLPAC